MEDKKPTVEEICGFVKNIATTLGKGQSVTSIFCVSETYFVNKKSLRISYSELTQVAGTFMSSYTVSRKGFMRKPVVLFKNSPGEKLINDLSLDEVYMLKLLSDNRFLIKGNYTQADTIDVLI